ncbi:MAG: hypothetical protein ABI352_10600 [Candidatus Dormibacter sp.]
MRPRTATAIVAPSALATAALPVIAWTFAYRNGDLNMVNSTFGPDLVINLGIFPVDVIVTMRRRDNPIGWLFLGCTFLGALHAASGGCDVTMDGTITSLLGVTFYLKDGAGICISLPSGLTISQTPYDGNSGAAGDGRYVVLSDNVANPTISLSSGGGGSTSGIWSVGGTIWLPTGTVNIANKSALEDSGQVIINTWNDQSGNHQNPGVSYNGTLAPAQNELLQLSE